MTAVYDIFDTPAGQAVALMDKGQLVELHLARGFSFKVARRDPELLSGVRRAVLRYFRGGRLGSVRLGFDWATPFERMIYEVVRRIAIGQTMTYGEVARKSGNAAAARAVGRAMGRNRICLFIP